MFFDKKLPFFRQRDQMDCGPTCLQMIANFYGRSYTLPFLREISYITREGVSLQGIMEAADRIGFRTLPVKIHFVKKSKSEPSFMDAPFPCILHWNHKHFVVAFKATKKYIWVAGPAQGKFKLDHEAFKKSWISGLSIGFFDTKMVGDLMQRVGDHRRVEAFLTTSSLRVLFSLVNFIVFGAVLLLYNFSIFGIFMVSSIAYILWITIFLKKRKEVDYQRFQEMSQNQNTLIEMIQGMQEIKLQNSERKRRRLWTTIRCRKRIGNSFLNRK